jgi:hypothetical protein
MKTKSTYSLLLNADAEEKGRSIFENAVYSVVLLCTALTVWVFVSNAVIVPGENAATTQTERVINTPVEQPLLATAN